MRSGGHCLGIRKAKPSGHPHPRANASAGVGWSAPRMPLRVHTTSRRAPTRAISIEYREAEVEVWNLTSSPGC